jgi:hypothetical protein
MTGSLKYYPERVILSWGANAKMRSPGEIVQDYKAVRT